MSRVTVLRTTFRKASKVADAHDSELKVSKKQMLVA